MSNGKLIIFSAPSGAGKTTIVQHLLKLEYLKLEFSISACSRLPRGKETNGKDYYFLSTGDFQKKIAEDAFLEWEEVYDGLYYGTLKSEIKRITEAGYNVMFDVDVKGGLNIKKQYGDKALAIFVQPPSLIELKNRLHSRSTDTAEAIAKRLDKAASEMEFASQFDYILINDVLDTSLKQAEVLVKQFIFE
jgi:guanylate kinase